MLITTIVIEVEFYSGYQRNDILIDYHNYGGCKVTPRSHHINRYNEECRGQGKKVHKLATYDC